MGNRKVGYTEMIRDIIDAEERKVIKERGFDLELIRKAKYVVGTADYVFAFTENVENENIDEVEAQAITVMYKICKLITENDSKAEELYVQCLREFEGKY